MELKEALTRTAHIARRRRRDTTLYRDEATGLYHALPAYMRSPEGMKKIGTAKYKEKDSNVE